MVTHLKLFTNIPMDPLPSESSTRTTLGLFIYELNELMLLGWC